MCWSRRRKAEPVTFRFHVQTPASFTLFVAQKPNQTFVSQTVQNLPRNRTGIHNAVGTKPYVKIGHMSDQQKAEFVDNIFCIRSFWGGHDKILPKNLIYTGRCNLSRNANSASGQVSDHRNSQIANRLDPFNRPSESWEGCLPKWYSGLPEF
jgi:hypothetical protein